MTAFPTRLTRSALGATLIDTYPVENPETDIGAASFNAAFWALAGASLMVPRAVLISSWTGAAFVTAHEAQAWNPDGGQTAPTLARSAAGVYTYTFASSYTDELGAAISLSILGARLSPMRALTGWSDRVSAFAWRDGSDPQKIQLRIFDSAGSGIDCPFWLEVF